jgi:predicted phosphodiesterase
LHNVECAEFSNCDVWGLIADVHANLPALERALATLHAAGARRLAFLGDYLGRGDSDACVRRIRALADLAVLGNRDLDWSDRVSPATRAWVLGLPRTAQRGRLLLAHGDARLTPALSTAQIRRDFLRTWRELEARGADILAFGHSHHARLWRKPALDTPAELLTSDSVPIDPHMRYMLNVGTTGLPFPGKGPPSVALVDFCAGRIEHRAISN